MVSQSKPLFSAQRPPASLCLLRLSALGDVTHMLPVVHRLQRVWPSTRLTWIVGRFEHKLVGDLPGVEFITFDKSTGLRGFRELHRQLGGRRFDTLLQMQVSLRANLLSALVRARYRLGFDPGRSRDLHGAFVNRRIPDGPGQHVVDAFQSFLDTLGAPPAPKSWALPVPVEDRAWAEEQLRGEQPSLLISPCSSHPLRNWRAEYYAQVADHAARRHGMRVVLCGGPSAEERAMGDAIRAAMATAAIDLIGRDTLKRLLALLGRARVLLTPDSGPAHLAACTATPVIGLHAASNPRRSGPYLSLPWCVDAYDEAARKFLGKPATQLRWGTKIERPSVMDLVRPERVCATLDRLMSSAGAA